MTLRGTSSGGTVGRIGRVVYDWFILTGLLLPPRRIVHFFCYRRKYALLLPRCTSLLSYIALHSISRQTGGQRYRLRGTVVRNRNRC